MNFEDFICQILYVLATGILPILTVYIVNFLKVKIKEQTVNLDNEEYAQLKEYVYSATDIIEQTVIEVNQIFVDKLKESGSFTEEAAVAAKNMAVEKCKELISENSKQAIEILYNDFNIYLNSKIEALVKKNKK